MGCKFQSIFTTAVIVFSAMALAFRKFSFG